MFDERSRFVMENYQKKPPFSSFLPGIAGRWASLSGAITITGGRRSAASARRTRITPLWNFSPPIPLTRP